MLFAFVTVLTLRVSGLLCLRAYRREKKPLSLRNVLGEAVNSNFIKSQLPRFKILTVS